MLSEHELRSLLLDGLSGNSRSYHAFFSEVSALLRQFVARRLFRLGRSENDVEDIVQEALIAIHSKGHTYDGETPVMAWAYAIARYKLIDSLRASSSAIEIKSLQEDMDGITDESVQADAKITVQKGLALLPDRLRVPLELTKLEGLTAGEAAKRMGIPEATVRVNVHRGLKALLGLCGGRRKGV